jgi:membrane associated rhomboid family serine protease
MVPIRDDNDSYTVPFVNYLLVLLNVLAFVFELSLGNRSLNRFLMEYAVVPAKLWPAIGHVLSGDLHALPLLLPLLSAMFLHGGFLHVAGNMLYLWIFGDNVEDRLGHFGYLCFYLICGVFASLVQSVFSPDSMIPSLGASGAIAGVLGAYIIKFPKNQVQAIFPIGFIPIPFKISAVWLLGFWFVQQAFNSVASVGQRTMTGVEQGGVAYWAHASGFALGALIALVFVRDLDPYRR